MKWRKSLIKEELRKNPRNSIKIWYAKTPTYADKKDIFIFIGKSKLKTLTPEENKMLEREINQNEVSQCLKGTRNNVAHGWVYWFFSTRFSRNC